MRASLAAGGRSQSQYSQFGRSFSMARSVALILRDAPARGAPNHQALHLIAFVRGKSMTEWAGEWRPSAL
jgi:hypothetical protein